MDYKNLPLPLKILNRATKAVQAHSIVIFVCRKKVRVRSRTDFYARQAMRVKGSVVLGFYQKGCDPVWIAEDLLTIDASQWEQWS